MSQGQLLIRVCVAKGSKLPEALRHRATIPLRALLDMWGRFLCLHQAPLRRVQLLFPSPTAVQLNCIQVSVLLGVLVGAVGAVTAVGVVAAPEVAPVELQAGADVLVAQLVRQWHQWLQVLAMFLEAARRAAALHLPRAAAAAAAP